MQYAHTYCDTHTCLQRPRKTHWIYIERIAIAQRHTLHNTKTYICAQHTLPTLAPTHTNKHTEYDLHRLPNTNTHTYIYIYIYKNTHLYQIILLHKKHTAHNT